MRDGSDIFQSFFSQLQAVEVEDKVVVSFHVVVEQFIDETEFVVDVDDGAQVVNLLTIHAAGKLLFDVVGIGVE